MQHSTKPGSAASTRTMLLSEDGPITDSLPILESFSRQFCSLRLVQSRLDCALFCCKARYFFQFGFLFVVLYPVEAKSSFLFSCYRLCQTCGSMFKKKKARRWSDIVHIGRWRDSFSSVFVL